MPEIKLREIKSVYPLKDYHLILEFENDEYRIIDVKPFIKGPVFEPIKNLAFFKQVRIDPDAGTVTWPNGADLDPDVLYEKSLPLRLPGEKVAEA
ncbi:MAG: DUF2442 domain-containing protein [Anaerolineae bacterium]